MYFEAAEKKLEIIRAADTQSLRSFDRSFWVKLVSVANAEILSSMHNDECDAYLLSESCLFVWNNKFVMITCGKSKLINSAQYFFDNTDEALISFTSYKRKNENYPQLQESNFQQDVELLTRLIPGKSLRVGNLDSHNHYLFTSNNRYQATKQSSKVELLMYQIDDVLAQKLQQKTMISKDVRNLIQVDSLFDKFIVDDHCFEPYGYSINGLYDDLYFTIHITPQDESSYASFETNIGVNEQNHEMLVRLLEIFKPVSFDIVEFNQKNTYKFDSFRLFALSNLTTQHSVLISYQHFHQSQVQVLIPQNV